MFGGSKTWKNQYWMEEGEITKKYPPGLEAEAGG
jgi:hypothetical protein